MAGAKIIKKRIASVKNTRKITRTMEMVATAKSKKLVDRVKAAQPYALKLQDIMRSVSDVGDRIDSPYLRTEEHPHSVAVLIVTANRGLCGGYNSNVLKLARAQIQILESEGKRVDVYAIGKKALSYLRFVKIPVKQSWTNFDDNFSYDQVNALAEQFMAAFRNRQYDLIKVISTIYYSAGSQRPGVTQLLPIGLAGAISDKEAKPAADKTPALSGPVIFDPAPEVIAQRILPLAVKTTLYRTLLEAVTSEQIYRRIAMKNATDAAGEMNRLLTRQYNRSRQGGITQELLEIVAGADAI
jgi:F-type H+-transporting ATPase subunit gamma